MQHKKSPLNHWQIFKRWLSSFFWLEPCAGAIITRERNGGKEILCIAHKKWGLMLPKWRWKIGESTQEIAVREIQEETGLYGFKLGREIATIRDRKRRKKITFFEVKNPSTTHAHIKDEAIIWTPHKEAVKKMRHESEKQLLAEYTK